MRTWTSLAPASDHTDDLAAGRAAHDGIIDEDHALAIDQAADGIELELHAEISDGLRRFDESASDVVIANQAHAKGNFGFERIADGRGHAGIGHGDDDIRIDGMLLREEASEHLAAFVHGAAKHNAVRAGEIDVFENALLKLFLRREVDGLDSGFRDAHHFAGFDLADVLGI